MAERHVLADDIILPAIEDLRRGVETDLLALKESLAEVYLLRAFLTIPCVDNIEFRLRQFKSFCPVDVPSLGVDEVVVLLSNVQDEADKDVY